MRDKLNFGSKPRPLGLKNLMLGRWLKSCAAKSLATFQMYMSISDIVALGGSMYSTTLFFLQVKQRKQLIGGLLTNWAVTQDS